MSNMRVNFDKAAASIMTQLDGNVVGYAFAIGNAASGRKILASGQARTTADPPAHRVDTTTKFCIHSVTKFVTALAVMSLLEPDGTPNSNRTPSSPIGPFLPSDWSVQPGSAVYNIRFAEILTHTSGLRDPGTPPGTYQNLKRYFTQELSLAAKVPESYCGFAFALARIFLPKLAGLKDPTGTDAQRADFYANQYVDIVNARVFHPVNVSGVYPWIGPGQTEAIAYTYPGDKPGFAWSTWRSSPPPEPMAYTVTGAGGLFASIDDFCPVLQSLCKNDGKIVSKLQWDAMTEWNTNLKDAQGKGPYWLPIGMGGQEFPTLPQGMVAVPILRDAKNNAYEFRGFNGGAWDSTGTESTAEVGVFGSPTPDPIVTNGPVNTVVENGPVYGVLLVNSTGADAAAVLQKALIDSLEPADVTTVPPGPIPKGQPAPTPPSPIPHAPEPIPFK